MISHFAFIFALLVAHCQYYDVMSDCDTLITGQDVWIFSPDYPLYYEDFYQCDYVVKRRTSDICLIEITFNDFDLQKSDNCVIDYLDLSDGQQGRFCGTLPLRTKKHLIFRPGQHTMTLRFKTDKDSLSIFKIRIKQIRSSCGANTFPNIPSLDSSVACSSEQPLVVTQNTGFIESPEFDSIEYYPANMSCSWLLKAPEGKVIVLKNTYFQLDEDCQTDILTVYSGQPPNHVQLDQLCGHKPRFLYKPEKNVLYFHFVSGSNPYNKGFQFLFEHVPAPVQCEGQKVTCRNGRKCVDESKICNGIDDCGDGTDEENCDSYFVQTEECGDPESHHNHVHYRMVGGNVSDSGSWPWQASLTRIAGAHFSSICGGVLIHSQWLLTAAHCFKYYLNDFDTKNWNVYMGKNILFDFKNPAQVRYVEAIHLHPENIFAKNIQNTALPWNVRMEHDLALVKLNAPVSFTDYILPVCLPAINYTLEPGRMCYFTGWGSTYGIGDEWVLKEARLPVVSLEECRKWHRVNIPPNMMCAGYVEGVHNPCEGDSGGPLVYFMNEKWHLAGILHGGGRVCGNEREPSIYVQVSYYLDWIRNVTGNSATE